MNDGCVCRTAPATPGLLIILKGTHSYKESLEILNLPTLKERRETLTAKFANKCLKDEKSKNMFKNNTSRYNMKLRHKRKFNEAQSKTKRFDNSPLQYMTRILNKENEEKEKQMKLPTNQ